MLRLTRESRSVRLLLLLAGLVAVSASFGLHPEPVVGAATGSAPALSYRLAPALLPHECPVCLTHRVISLARLSATVLSFESIVASAVVPKIPLPERPEVRPRQNRAPPLAS